MKVTKEDVDKAYDALVAADYAIEDAVDAVKEATYQAAYLNSLASRALTNYNKMKEEYEANESN